MNGKDFYNALQMELREMQEEEFISIKSLIKNLAELKNQYEYKLNLLNNGLDRLDPDKVSSEILTTEKYLNKIAPNNNRYKISQKIVRDLLIYNPYTGELLWRESQLFGKRETGSTATRLSTHGYLIVSLKSKVYLAHRIIWLYVYGYMPEHQIDHIDRNKTNNKLNNLRETSASCNVKNSKISKLNKSGVKGVIYKKRKKAWIAFIKTDNKVVMKQCQEFDEAVCYRLAFEQCLDWNLCSIDSTAYNYLVKKNIIKHNSITKQPQPAICAKTIEALDTLKSQTSPSPTNVKQLDCLTILEYPSLMKKLKNPKTIGVRLDEEDLSILLSINKKPSNAIRALIKEYRNVNRLESTDGRTPTKGN